MQCRPLCYSLSYNCTLLVSQALQISTPAAVLCPVLQDCSIQISPISDPTCSEPFSTTGHPYGAIQQTAYYMADGNGGFKIESPPRNSPAADGINIRQAVGASRNSPGAIGVSIQQAVDSRAGIEHPTSPVPTVCSKPICRKTKLISIVQAGGNKLTMKWVPMTTSPDESTMNADLFESVSTHKGVGLACCQPMGRWILAMSVPHRCASPTPQAMRPTPTPTHPRTSPVRGRRPAYSPICTATSIIDVHPS